MSGYTNADPTMTTSSDEWDNYEKWEEHDVTGVYIEISENEKDDYYSVEEYDDRYFVSTKLKSGLYKVEMKDKVDSRFWGLAYSSLFIKFRFNPFLFKFDEGVLDWNGYNGTFYKKP